MVAPKKARPRLYYGWVIVFASLAIMTVAVGLHQSFGIFLKPLLQDFGWTRAQTAGAFSLGNIIQGASAIVIGLMANRFGPRRLIALSGILLGVSYVLVARVTVLWQLYIYYSLLQGVARGAHFNPMVATLARWFTQRRGLALGLVLAGGGIGTVLFPVLGNYLIQHFNWRTAFIVFGIISGGIFIAAALLYRASPREMGLLPYGEKAEASPGQGGVVAVSAARDRGKEEGISIGQAMRTRSFWLLALNGGLSSFAVNVVFVHLVAYATDVNIPATVAASFISVLGIFNIIGKLGMGIFSDRYGIKLALIICFALGAVMMLWVSQASAVWMFILFSAAFGFAYAGWIPLFPGMAAHLFGLRSLEAVVGFQTAGNNLGGAAGAFLAGYIFDVTQSYKLAFLLAAALLALSILFHLMIRQPQKQPLAVVGEAP